MLDKFDEQIRVLDLDTHEQIPIPAKRPFDPHKTLGHIKAPTSTQHTRIEQLVTKANRIALLAD